MEFKCFVMIICILFLPRTVCHEDAKTLFDLVSEYSKSHYKLQHPDSGSATDVRIGLNVLNIEELDETKQTLTLSAWFGLQWIIENLSWNKSKYENSPHIAVSPLDIWVPDLVLVNAQNGRGYFAGTDLPAIVYSSGAVDWFVFDQWKISCKIDVTHFPIDSQKCQFNLHQWNSFAWEVNYISIEPPFTFLDFKESGEWTFSNYKFFDISYNGSFNNGSYHKLVFEIVLDRRSAYYMLAAVLPTFVLSALNLLVFHVPPGSGEKLTLCVSIFLSYAVYLTSINSMMPTVSDHVALFSIYLNSMFILKALTIATTVFILRLHSVQERSFIRSLLTKWLVQNNNRITVQNEDTKVTENSSQGDSVACYSGGECNYTEQSWKEMVMKLERVLFHVFFFIFIASTTGFFVAFAI